MQKLSGRKLLLIGFTLFSMFFGAGNLIFPPDLGAKAGHISGPAFLGLAIQCRGAARCRSGGCGRAQGLEKLAGRVHPVFAQVFMILIYLSIGPCLAIPRTASTSFAMLAPLVGTGAGLQLGYSVVFFAAAFLVALAAGKTHPLAGQAAVPLPAGADPGLVWRLPCCTPWQGSTASPPRSIPLVPYYRAYCMATRPWTPGSLELWSHHCPEHPAQGVTRQEEVQRSTILAGFVAGGLLLAVYAMLGHAGALTGPPSPALPPEPTC